MKKLLLVLICLYPLSTAAATQIEIVELQGRTVEEVIPILQPMLAPGGALSGTGYKLIVRSTPENIAQLRALLAEIDKTPEQLLISVSDDLAVLDESQAYGGRITINKNGNTASVGAAARDDSAERVHAEQDGVRVEAQGNQRYQTRREPRMQQVRVTEGLWAAIQFGQTIPYATRSINPDGTVTETVTYEPVTSGFQVLPRVQGEIVSLSIRPQRQSVGGGTGGGFDTASVDTTVRAKLGEWIELGGSHQSASSSYHRPGYSRQSRSGEQQRIFVKVERITQ